MSAAVNKISSTITYQRTLTSVITILASIYIWFVSQIETSTGQNVYWYKALLPLVMKFIEGGYGYAALYLCICLSFCLAVCNEDNLKKL